MSTVSFTDPIAVEAVLRSAAFEPPQSPAISLGATAELRAGMARFSSHQDHSLRRDAVEMVIDSLAGFDFREEAERRTRSQLVGDSVEAVADLAFVVPTETLATALLVDESELVQLRSDVLAVVAVIGRQEPATAEADASAERLVLLFRDHPAGPVAAISLLYQNHDATAALLAAELFAHHRGVARRSAIARTTRIAMQATVVNGTDVAAGQTAILDLESTGFEFGAGPHQCPGQHVAEQIVAGVLAAISALGYVVADDGVELHPDGRPKAMRLRPG